MSVVVRCPKCGNQSLERTKIINNGDWTYRCKKCLLFLGSPTEWARCSRETFTSKDTYHVDCHGCPMYHAHKTLIRTPTHVSDLITRPDSSKKMCPYFQGQVGFNEVYHSKWFKEHKLKILEI